MAILGGILIVVGIVLFFIQNNARQKMKSLKQARTSTVADLVHIAQGVAAEIGAGSWRDYVKLWGQIHCDTPLTSELKQVPCVYYEMQVEREYEETVTERDSEGRTTRKTERHSEIVSQNRQSIPFLLQDSTGQVLVDPSGATIETVSVLDEFRDKAAAGSTVSFGSFSLSLGGDRDGRRTLGYRYRESILPLNRSVLVLGLATDARPDEQVKVAIEKPTTRGQKFMISLKSADQLRQGAENTAKYTFWGMVVALIAGVVLLVLGLTS